MTPAVVSIETRPAETLESLVTQQSADTNVGAELRCLASAIYFEAGNETLSGQLAVGRVIVDRTKSGRFPASYCGVVHQHSQFSFVRHGAIPAVKADCPRWRHAVAVARIADTGSWQSPVEGALYFHAARINPAWRMQRIAQVDNHIFYH